MSPLVVLTSLEMLCSMNLPFLSSLLCPLSPPTPTPSLPILISTSLLPSIVPVASSHESPTIDSSPPPLPPPSHTPSPLPPPTPTDESFSSSSSASSASPPPTRTHHMVIRTQDNTRTLKVWLATRYPMSTCLMANLDLSLIHI